MQNLLLWCIVYANWWYVTIISVHAKEYKLY